MSRRIGLRTMQSIGGKSVAPKLFEDGFESGDFSKWTGESGLGTRTVQSAIKYSGTYAARVESIPHDGFDYIFKDLPDLSPYSSIKHIMYIYVDSAIFATDGEIHTVIDQMDTSYDHVCGASIVRSGSDYRWGLEADIYEELLDILEFNRWYKVELRTILSDIPDDSSVSLYIDDVLKTTISGWLFTNSREICKVAFGNCWGTLYGSTFDPLIIYGDDCLVIGEAR